MRLHRLRLVNFRQYADCEIVVGPGITGIIGPNGSGKSTLLEAIAWAIYGNAAARGDKDGIRNLRAKPRTSVRVELEFGLGAHEYRVVRGLHGAELYQDGVVVANSLTEVTTGLERVLGMRHDEFFNTYFTGQKELAVMASLGKTDRAAFLSRVLGYDRLRLAQERVRERRNALASELRGLEAGLPESARPEAERTTAAARLAGGRRAAEAAGGHGAAGGRPGERRRWRAGVARRIDALGTATATLADAEREVLALAQRLEAAERTAAEQRAVWVREKEYAATRRTELLRQYDDLKEQRDKIELLGPEGECPTCRRPLGAEHGAVLGILDRQLQAIVDDGKFFRQRLEQLAQPPAAVTTAEAERDTLRDDSRRASERAGELRAQAEELTRATQERAGAARPSGACAAGGGARRRGDARRARRGGGGRPRGRAARAGAGRPRAPDRGAPNRGAAAPRTRQGLLRPAGRPERRHAARNRRARLRLPRRPHRRPLRGPGPERGLPHHHPRRRPPQAGALGRRGGRGQPGAAARDLADDRRARRATAVVARAGRDLRLARRVPSAARRLPAAPLGGPLPPGQDRKSVV